MIAAIRCNFTQSRDARCHRDEFPLECRGCIQRHQPQVTGQPNEWYIPVAGGVVGLFLFPSLYKKLLPVITAIMGGLCVAWSVGAGEDLRVVGSVAAIGVVVQLASGARGKGGGDKDD